MKKSEKSPKYSGNLSGWDNFICADSRNTTDYLEISLHASINLKYSLLP